MKIESVLETLQRTHRLLSKIHDEKFVVIGPENLDPEIWATLVEVRGACQSVAGHILFEKMTK